MNHRSGQCEHSHLIGRQATTNDVASTAGRYETPLTVCTPALQLRTAVKYLQFSNGKITLATNCDMFVYMNGELVVDLGGVHGSQSATLNLGTVRLIHTPTCSVYDLHSGLSTVYKGWSRLR